MSNQDNYEFGKAIGNNSVSGSYSGIVTASGCMIFVVGFIVISIIAAAFTFSEDGEMTDNSEKATQTTEQITESEDTYTESSGDDSDSYENDYVPPGAEEALYPDYDEIMMDEVYDHYYDQEQDFYEDNKSYPW